MFISTLDLGRHLKVSHRMKKDARTCALAVAKTIYSERVQFKLIPTQVNQVDESTEKQFFPKGIETPKNASNAKSVYGSNELDLSRKQRTEIDEGMLVKKRSVIPPVPSVLGEIFPISYQVCLFLSINTAPVLLIIMVKHHRNRNRKNKINKCIVFLLLL